MTFVPLSPIPLKDRTSMIFLQYGQIDVLDGAFVLIDKTGIRTHIPVGSVACIMLEPGTRVPTRRCIWPPRWEHCWSGSVKRAFAFTLPDNPEGRGQINYSTRQSWL